MLARTCSRIVLIGIGLAMAAGALARTIGHSGSDRSAMASGAKRASWINSPTAVRP